MHHTAGDFQKGGFTGQTRNTQKGGGGGGGGGGELYASGPVSAPVWLDVILLHAQASVLLYTQQVKFL